MDKAKLKNIPSGSDGKGYITLNGEVLPAFLIRKVSANIGMIVESKRFLGDRMKQNAVRGMEGKGNITYYHSHDEDKPWDHREHRDGALRLSL